jgi:FkbM family methyltransferase
MFYGQKKEDQKIRELLGENDPGFYIDVGAWHPDTESVTKHFYDRDWNGINIEPVEKLYSNFVSSRHRDINLKCAIGQKNDVQLMKVVCNQDQITGLSTLNKKNSDSACVGRNYYEERVHIYTLEYILDHNTLPGQVIDFLKIDVEGFEKEVIYSNNWSKYRPRVLCIESTVPCTTIRCDSWDGYVQAICRYDFICFDGLNNFYTRKEKW